MIEYAIGAAGAAIGTIVILLVKKFADFVEQTNATTRRVHSEFDGNAALYRGKASNIDLKWLENRVAKLEACCAEQPKNT